jgi:hypothetical protein
MDEEGQVTLEEDRVSMKGVRLWRTVQLFRSEVFTIGVGILIIFVQVAMNLYIPQLTQLYQEALLVVPCCTATLIQLKFPFFRFCADSYSNIFEKVFAAEFLLKENGVDLGSRSAFSFNGTRLFPCTNNDQGLKDGFTCECSGIHSDPPTSVRAASHAS